MNEDEQKEAQVPEPKRKSVLWPMLLWPLVGVPVYWLVACALWPKPDGKVHDAGRQLGPMIVALFVSEAICFGLGAWQGIRHSRQNKGKDPLFGYGFGFGLLGALLGLAYNFGGCTIGPLLFR